MRNYCFFIDAVKTLCSPAKNTLEINFEFNYKMTSFILIKHPINYLTMKRIFTPILMAVVMLSSGTGYSQQGGRNYDLLFLSGKVSPAENMNEAARLKADPSEILNGTYYRLVQFKDIPTDQQKADLKSSGVELLWYFPNYAFFAAIRSDVNFSSLTQRGIIRSVLPVLPEYKLHPYLKDGGLPAEAEIVAGKADLILVYYKGLTNAVIEAELSARVKGIEILANDDKTQIVHVRVKKEEILSLTHLPFIQYVEPYEPYQMENNSGTTEHRSNTLNSPLPSGLHFDGTGVGVSIGDGGLFYAHVDFTGRQSGAVTTGAADHATHVTGTVGGAGNIDPRYKGQATGAKLLSTNGFADIQSVTAFGTLHNGADSIRVTNHSLGEGVNAGYTSTARTSDLIVETYQNAFNVHSAGNSGTGWNTITGGYKAGKNSIATGALDYKDLVTSFSSRGPSKDGRIKPDICAKGDNVMSTMPANPNQYNTMSGTSMASPGAAGCFTQLIHAYRSHNSGNDPKLATLKAIVLNTAQDLGNTGPDYTYGWGRINVRAAYEAIKNNRYTSGTMANGGTANHTITVPANCVEARVMVYWADPAAATGATKALINDLDITVKAGTTTYQPWQLNPSSPGTAAVKGTDTDNNMEQVSITSPAAGTYTLTVNGTTVPQGPQEYWVTWEFITDDIVVTYPMGGESLAPSETHYIRWDAGGNTGTFTVEYSGDNGATWVTISSSVAGTARYLSWTTPAAVTGQALIRVTRGSKSDVSDANFNIIGVPTGLTVLWRCPTNFELKWNAVTGATDYEVYCLGQKYMVSQGTTPWLSFIVNAPSTQVTWASVRAMASNFTVKGRRAVAIQVGTSTANCPPTGIFEFGENSPYGLSIYPNPANAQSTITAYLPQDDEISITLVDMFGREAMVIQEETRLNAGEHTFALPSMPASGMYLLRISGSQGVTSGKIMID